MYGSAIEELLGGTEIIGHEIRNEMDLYEISKKGLPKKALVHLIHNLGFTVKFMASLINITERTIQRKNDIELLDKVTSEQVLQIADIYSKGTHIFESSENFSTWITIENKALNNKKPIELLSSRYGAQMVLDELGKIEYGIIA
jgi:putative toxin-antitoxin system antitoxin component (TIGR02293 family)